MLGCKRAHLTIWPPFFLDMKPTCICGSKVDLPAAEGPSLRNLKKKHESWIVFFVLVLYTYKYVYINYIYCIPICL